MKARITFALAMFVLAGCSGSRTEGLDASKIPAEVRDDYRLFARRCSKCHSLSRPLTANISDDDQWVNYVNRMRRQPGSGISRDDQAHILRFLRYYAADLRATEAARRPPVTIAPPAPPASPVDAGEAP